MSRKFFAIVFLIFLARIDASAQDCINPPYAFMPGERILYEVSFNWGLIWIDAGEVDFSAEMTTHHSKPAYHFFSTGRSYRHYDWMFKVRDTFEVISSLYLRPITYRRHTLEGGFRINNRYDFIESGKKVFARMEETRRPYTERFIPISECTIDVLTATYVARSMDFGLMQIGDTTGLSIILDGRVFTLPIVFLGKEIYTDREKHRHNTIKFTAVLDKGTMFRSGEAVTVWVSDDHKKIPLLIEAKITVGSIKVHLKKYQQGKRL
jgi:hypothetical protein